MKEDTKYKKNTVTENNNKNLESSTPIKPIHIITESKLSEATLNNSSDIDLCQESKLDEDINKSNSTITLSSSNSLNNVTTNLKKKTSKDTITIGENEKTNLSKKSTSSSKKSKRTPLSSSSSSSIQDSKKTLKKDRNPHLSTDKTSITITHNSKLSKPSPPINSSLKSKVKTTTPSKTSKNSINTSSTTENKTISNHNNNNNYNSSNNTSSSINNITSSLQRKSSSNQLFSQDMNKKVSFKQSGSPEKMTSSNKSVNQNSKKLIKTDIRKSLSSQNEISSRIERNKQYNDSFSNRNSSQLKLKKSLYPQKENPINEKEIVLKSNEYRKAIAKINSLEKTIKQLQAQHSETLSCLHSEIERLQRACSEKTLSEAFKGTGLLTSLSANNLIHNKPGLERSNSLGSSTDSLDQDILIQTLNNLPKGMNLLPKIKKPTEENNNKTEILSNEKNNYESNEIASFKEEGKMLNDSSDINKIKNNNETIDKMSNIKRKTSGNIRAHKYHSIEKINKNTNDLSPEHPKSSLSEVNIMSNSSGSHKQIQSIVSLSEASTAVALSSDHASLSSLMKSDITLKESKNDFINNIKANSKLALSLNRQLPPPLPPNYARSNKTSESPRRLINLPKILQPITKIKGNKNTSINLPSLIKNKTTKK
ncbi:hypothetical protein PIROE2DRAFT_56741 [Piromyces sp. E2]|nr:hypothetical protein PIROE2DRAFT_56741 [Piromyces sp. E2]|eukprot:OUM70425.1 hypothetical protein PIROE2DRAFT_56741 [Piromyces sp. E2]